MLHKKAGTQIGSLICFSKEAGILFGILGFVSKEATALDSLDAEVTLEEAEEKAREHGAMVAEASAKVLRFKTPANKT